jgi:CheY-like chemotaxis protein
VQATVAKDRGVRFTALETIMSLEPKEPFAGSSLVADSLVWFAKSEGEKVVVSGHPQKASALQTANLFLGLGYKSEVATTCRELFQLAAASPDVEVVVVDVRCSQPPVGEFVQAMRQDARTANIPIAILSDDVSPGDVSPPLLRVRRNEMTQSDRRSPDNPFCTSLSLTYPRPADEKSAQWVLDDLLNKTADGRRQTAEERLEEAKQALGWLREIKLAELSGGQKIYHFDDFDSVVLEALRSEVRVQEGLQLAAVVKSVAVQSALYEMAANAVYPMELRNQAGEAFEENIDRFGILLRGQQVQRLYDRYNQSELEPKESQELLSRLIDVVEAKAGK